MLGRGQRWLREQRVEPFLHLQVAAAVEGAHGTALAVGLLAGEVARKFLRHGAEHVPGGECVHGLIEAGCGDLGVAGRGEPGAKLVSCT